MKKISLIFAAFAMISCNQQVEKETVVSNIFLEQKVNEFVAQNPQWTSGGTVNEEITDKFQHEVKRLSNEPEFLNNMPLQLNKLRDTTLSGTKFKIGTFTGYNDNTRPIGSVLNYIQLKVDGFLSPEMQKQVSIDGKYTIEGVLYKQGSRKDVKIIHVADFNGYDLGNYLFSITKVTPVGK